MALILSLFAYMGVFDVLINLSPVPGLESAAEDYFERTREKATYTYVAARLLNASISILQSVHLSAGIVSADPLQFLDPVDDLVEKFSTIMLISLASVLTQELLLKIGSLVAFSAILPIAFLVLALKPWLPQGMHRRCLGLFYGIVVVTLVAKLFSPVTGAVGSYVSEEFLIADYNEAVADISRLQTELTAESAALPSSEDINNTLSAQSAKSVAPIQASQVMEVPVESEEEVVEPVLQQSAMEEPISPTSDIQTPEEVKDDEDPSEPESGGFFGKLKGMMDDTTAATKTLMKSTISGTEKLIDNPVDVTKQFASDAASATVDAAVATKDLTVEAAGVTAEAAADAFSATGSFVDKSFDAMSDLLPSFVFPDVQSIKESLGNIADSILVLIKIFVFEVLLLPLLSGYLLYRLVRSVFQVGGVYEVHPSSPQTTALATHKG